MLFVNAMRVISVSEGPRAGQLQGHRSNALV